MKPNNMRKSRHNFFTPFASKVPEEIEEYQPPKHIKYKPVKERPFNLKGWAGYQDAQMFRKWRGKDVSEQFKPMLSYHVPSRKQSKGVR